MIRIIHILADTADLVFQFVVGGFEASCEVVVKFSTLAWRLTKRHHLSLASFALGVSGTQLGRWLMPKFVGPNMLGVAETIIWSLFGMLIIVVSLALAFAGFKVGIWSWEKAKSELVWMREAWNAYDVNNDPRPRSTPWPPPPPSSANLSAAETRWAAFVDELNRQRLINTSAPELVAMTRTPAAGPAGEPCPHCRGTGRVPEKPEFPPNRFMSEGAWAMTDEPARRPTEEI